MVGCRHAYYIITCYVLHPLLLARFVREGSAAWRRAARGTNPYYIIIIIIIFIMYGVLQTPYGVLRIIGRFALLFCIIFALSGTPSSFLQ